MFYGCYLKNVYLDIDSLSSHDIDYCEFHFRTHTFGLNAIASSIKLITGQTLSLSPRKASRFRYRPALMLAEVATVMPPTSLIATACTEVFAESPCPNSQLTAEIYTKPYRLLRPNGGKILYRNPTKTNAGVVRLIFE